MTTRLTLSSIFLVAMVATSVWFFGWHQRADRMPTDEVVAAAQKGERPAPSARPVALTTPKDYLGVVLTGDTVELAPKAEGRVTEIFVKPGDSVLRGAVLAQLDVVALKQELHLAKAGLQDARQRLARRIPLAKSEAISSEEIANAKELVIERGSRVNQLTQAIAEARLKSPFDGLVAARYVDAGSLVGPGRPVLRLISQSDPRVRFAIPEDQAGKLKVGNRVRLNVKTLKIELPAIIDIVAPEVDTASRMIFAEGKITVPPSLKNKLSSGLVALVSPIDAEREGQQP